MIISFGDKQTQKIWEGERVKGLSTEIQELARRKLRMLNNSNEKLKANLKEFYSIRINTQWRIIFKWKNNNADLVEIIDYH